MQVLQYLDWWEQVGMEPSRVPEKHWALMKNVTPAQIFVTYWLDIETNLRRMFKVEPSQTFYCPFCEAVKYQDVAVLCREITLQKQNETN